MFNITETFTKTKNPKKSGRGHVPKISYKLVSKLIF